MARGEYLNYAGELIDDGGLLTVQYGSKWAAYLLAAAASLIEPDVWEPTDDVELAVEQANELLVRLMGMEELIVQDFSQLPMQIEPFGMKCDSAETVNWSIRPTSEYFTPAIVSDSTNRDIDWVHFDVFLPTGAYQIYFVMSRDTNRGKVKVVVSGDAYVADTTFDLYAGANDPDYWFSMGITVPTDGFHRITLEKKLKNPASSAGYLVLGRVIIGEA